MRHARPAQQERLQTMRFASFILPNSDNSGASLADVHAALRSSAVDVFGGFTAVASLGGWRDATTGNVHVEEGTEYRFAGAADADLLSFARFYGHMAGQLEVCIAYASGEVAFVDLRATVLA